MWEKQSSEVQEDVLLGGAKSMVNGNNANTGEVACGWCSASS